MAYDITNLKADLEGVMHGTTNNQITNLDGVIDRAARQLLLDIDPQETKRILEFVNPIFTQVYDYAVPVDLKGNKIIDIRPQVNRTSNDVFLQQYNQGFDITKTLSLSDDFTIQFNTGQKTVRINAPNLQPGILINMAANINDNGTWNVSGGAQNLLVNNINYVAGGGSLQFNLAAGFVAGSLENSTFTKINLSNVVNQSTLFLFTYLPLASAVSSVELRWGNDALNYYSRTVTVNQQNTVFQNGWNLLAFNWAGSSVVGIPNPSSIGYLKITWNYNSTLQTAVLFNNVVSRLGSILEIEYYSKFLFRDAVTGAFQEKVSSDSNLINLDTESYNLLFYQVALMSVQQALGEDSTYDTNYFTNNYTNGIARYKALYKSEIQKPQGTYYSTPQAGYTQYIGNNRYGF